MNEMNDKIYNYTKNYLALGKIDVLVNVMIEK